VAFATVLEIFPTGNLLPILEFLGIVLNKRQISFDSGKMKLSNECKVWDVKKMRSRKLLS